MKNISIGFYDDIYDDIKKRADKKGITTSKYVRELTELGLKIEDMSENKPRKQENPIDKLIERNLISSQETLYLARYIAANVTEKNVPNFKKIMEDLKVQAQSFVEGLQS